LGRIARPTLWIGLLVGLQPGMNDVPLFGMRL
jgi:hypothetical protein